MKNSPYAEEEILQRIGKLISTKRYNHTMSLPETRENRWWGRGDVELSGMLTSHTCRRGLDSGEDHPGPMLNSLWCTQIDHAFRSGRLTTRQTETPELHVGSQGIRSPHCFCFLFETVKTDLSSEQELSKAVSQTHAVSPAEPCDYRHRSELVQLIQNKPRKSPSIIILYLHGTLRRG